MSVSHRPTRAVAAALASASTALLIGLLAPPASAATAAPPASSSAAPSSVAPAETEGVSTTVVDQPSTTFVVRPGDTLTGIAGSTGTPGGWPALYAANRDAVGPSPDRLLPGTVLVLPAPPAASPATAPTTVVVQPGDTLREIARRADVDGGWPALLAANRGVLGDDPDLLQVGTELVVPVAAAPASPGAATVPDPAPSSPGAETATPSPTTATPSPTTATPTAEEPAGAPPARDASTPARVPGWVLWPLVAVAVLALGALVADPLLALVRRRRTAPAGLPRVLRVVQDGEGASPAPVHPVGAAPAPPAPPAAQVPRPVVHVRDHPVLLVGYSAADDLVIVLAPAGQDVEEALHTARVVLPDAAYRAVEAQLPSALVVAERRCSPLLGA